MHPKCFCCGQTTNYDIGTAYLRPAQWKYANLLALLEPLVEVVSYTTTSMIVIER